MTILCISISFWLYSSHVFSNHKSTVVSKINWRWNDIFQIDLKISLLWRICYCQQIFDFVHFRRCLHKRGFTIFYHYCIIYVFTFTKLVRMKEDEKFNKSHIGHIFMMATVMNAFCHSYFFLSEHREWDYHFWFWYILMRLEFSSLMISLYF